MKQQTKLIIGVLAFALVIAGAFFAYQALSRNTAIDDIQPSTNSVKEKAPDFTVADENGREIRLSELRGMPVVVNFWANWCPPCRAEMPAFDNVWAEFRGGKIAFMMVNLTDGMRETVEAAGDFIKAQGYAFPVYYDTQGEAAAAYGVRSIPTTLFIGRDGNVVHRAQGEINEATLRSYIELIR